MMKQSPTELLKKNNSTIDKVSTLDALILMLDDQKIAIEVINAQLKKFKEIIDMLIKHFKTNSSGRLIYCGSGTSARIGVQDGVELFPTLDGQKAKLILLLLVELKL